MLVDRRLRQHQGGDISLNQMIVDEGAGAARPMRGAQLDQDNRVVYGGGAAELTRSLAVSDAADRVERASTSTAFRAFSQALDRIPMTLAENFRLDPNGNVVLVEVEAGERARVKLGVDCLGKGTNDMKELFVIDRSAQQKAYSDPVDEMILHQRRHHQREG